MVTGIHGSSERVCLQNWWEMVTGDRGIGGKWERGFIVLVGDDNGDPWHWQGVATRIHITGEKW